MDKVFYLMVLNYKSDCKFLRNTKGLQLQLKSPNIYYYVKMLDSLEKKVPKISNGTLGISVHLSLF